MVQAATAGVVDFGRADPRDSKWWLGLQLILDRLERENLKEYHRLYHDRVLAVLGRDELPREAADALIDESDRRITRIGQILFPWADLDPNAARQKEAERLKASWESWFGRLDDPETRRRIQQTADWLNRTNKANRKGRR
jgi:hypothetical protein